MIDYLEIKFWQVAKWIIRKGYGDACKEYNNNCACCRANKVVECIDNHIRLIKT